MVLAEGLSPSSPELEAPPLLIELREPSQCGMGNAERGIVSRHRRSLGPRSAFRLSRCKLAAQAGVAPAPRSLTGSRTTVIPLSMSGRMLRGDRAES